MNSSLLNRFIEAQAEPHSGFEAALKELQSGRKTSHWIWYIFPQLAGLGRSSTAKFYGLANLAEAQAYLSDPVLGSRLQIVTGVVREKLAQGTRLDDLMGSAIDSAKLVSCLTLFEAVIPSLGPDLQRSDLPAFSTNVAAILRSAEQQGYPRCHFTLTDVKATP